MNVIHDTDIARFEPGDIVRIRNDISSREIVPFNFTEEMEQFRGMEFEITEVDHNSRTWHVGDGDICKQLEHYGFPFSEDDELIISKYRLRSLDGDYRNVSDYSWCIFMFDLSFNSEYAFDGAELTFENLDLLYCGMFK